MARAGQNLFLKKTLRASGSTTFNAPGNYLPPYGSTVIQIGGRGSPGNNTVAAIPGNSVPGNSVPGNAVPGNYAGANPGSPGNVAGNNPATLAGHNYGTWMYVGMYMNTYSGSPPGLSPSYFTIPGVGSGPPGGAQHTGTGPNPTSHFAASPPADPSFYGQNIQQNGNFGTTNYNGNPNFSPGNPNYNPYSPGNPNYNPTNHNPTTTNPTTTNPTTTNPTTPAVPGNTGPSANIEGVTLPGGPADSPANVVPATSTSIVYTGSNISITVPSGGYVTIQNV